MSEKEQFDQFEAWWKTLNIYDPTLKALCGSAWMQAIRSTSVTTAAGCCCAAEVTDRRGVVLVPGQKVFVLQTEQTRIATVVEVTEKRSSNGWWVDVDFGRGPEGVPSDILEVCNAPSPSPQQPAEDPDEWVVQDRVPPRKDIDQICWGGGDWHSDWHKEWQFENMMHGDYPRFGGRLNVRCRRRDLPKVEQPQLDVIGTLSFDPATGEYSRKPQPQKTRVRLWKGHTNSQVVASIFDLSQNGHWQELHHDSEGFYVEQGQ